MIFGKSLFVGWGVLLLMAGTFGQASERIPSEPTVPLWMRQTDASEGGTLAFTTDERSLVVQTETHRVEKIGTSDGTTLSVWQSAATSPKSVLSPDHRFAVTPFPGREGTFRFLRVQDARTGKTTVLLRAGRPLFWRDDWLPTAFSPDGRLFAVVSEGEDTLFVFVWNVATGRLLKTLDLLRINPNAGAGYDLRFSLDSTRLLTLQTRLVFGEPAQRITTAVFWNTQTWRPMHRLPEVNGTLEFDVLPPHKRTYLAGISWNRNLGSYEFRAWNLKSGREIRSWSGDSGGKGLGSDTAGTFAANGKRLAIYFYDSMRDYVGNTVRVMETASGKEICRVQVNVQIRKITLTKAGTRLAVLEEDGTLSLWDLPGMKEKE